MNHIGSIIKEFRLLRQLTQEQLAENICSEKYVYLIEKGERTPSTDLLRQFSDKLKVDLFGFYRFIDCSDPVKVCEMIDDLTFCQKKGDFSETEKLVQKAEKMPDFKTKPWIHILEANRIACKVFNEKKYKESIADIKSALNNVEDNHRNSIFVLSLYVLLSTCYQILGQIEEAKVITEKINHIIKNKYNNVTHNHIIITGRISLLTFYYHSGEFDKAIDMGEGLVEFQEEVNSLDRIHYAFAFLAFTYYKTENFTKAFYYFRKTIFTLMTYYNQNDVHYIMSIDQFSKMANDKKMNQDVMNLFFEWGLISVVFSLSMRMWNNCSVYFHTEKLYH